MVKYFSPTFFLAFLGVVSIELNDPKKLVLDLNISCVDEYVDEDVSCNICDIAECCTCIDTIHPTNDQDRLS